MIKTILIISLLISNVSELQTNNDFTELYNDKIMLEQELKKERIRNEINLYYNNK